MDLKYQMKTLEFINKIINRRAEELAFIDPIMVKAEMPEERAAEETKEKERLPRCTPEEQGVESGYLASFFRELSESDEIHLHTVMVLRGGHVIAEGSCQPYDSGIWHVCHSMSKSVTGLAVGIARGEGLLNLDDRLVDIFRRRVGPIQQLRKKNLSVWHLLTMSSGVSFNETGAVTEEDWVKGYLESGFLFEPGEKFYYNSMNSYMLSAAIREITGQNLTEYLAPRLFEPMGITKLFWQRCPKGTELGGWGLYLLPEDMAKLGLLMLNRGCWNGRQLVPADWIDEMSEKWMDTPKEIGLYGYGYQVWMCERQGSFQFNGMLGQNVFVFPDIDMVIVTTAGSEELFQVSGISEIVEKYFPPEYRPQDRPLPKNAAGLSELNRVREHMCCKEERIPISRHLYRGGFRKQTGAFAGRRKETACPARHSLSFADAPALQSLNGKEYGIERPGGSVLPLFLQCIHNNYTGGIERLAFAYRDGHLYLTVTEQSNSNTIPIGFLKAVRTRIRINGERYLISCTGKLREDEDGIPMLIVRLYFLEEANVRTIKISFRGSRITVMLLERPGRKMILDGVGTVLSGVKGLVGTVTNVLDSEYIEYKIRNTIDVALEGRIIKK